MRNMLTMTDNRIILFLKIVLTYENEFEMQWLDCPK